MVDDNCSLRPFSKQGLNIRVLSGSLFDELGHGGAASCIHRLTGRFVVDTARKTNV